MTAFIVSCESQEAARFINGEFSPWRRNKYHRTPLDERRRPQVSRVLTVERQPVKRQCCAHSHLHPEPMRERPPEQEMRGRNPEWGDSQVCTTLPPALPGSARLCLLLPFCPSHPFRT